MTWQNELDELRKREAFAEELGGPERVKRQKDGGRYTIRERIALMADLNSFHETGKIGGLAEYDSDNNLKKVTIMILLSELSIYAENLKKSVNV